MHATLGTFATPRRAKQFLIRNGVKIAEEIPISDPAALEDFMDRHHLAPTLVQDLLGGPPQPTACDLAKATIEQASIGQVALERARIVAAEAGVPYPIAGEQLIQQMVTEFNAIKDGGLMDQLTRAIVANAKNTDVGMDIAGFAAEVVAEIRRKDRIACDIVRITTLLDQTIAHAEKIHREIKVTEEQRAVLQRALSNEPLDDADRTVLKKLFDCDDVENAVKEYTKRARQTRSVEEYIS